MIVGDAVLIWRTWAVYRGRILAILMPCILLLASFGEFFDFIRLGGGH
jgi:hypothetical protein